MISTFVKIFAYFMLPGLVISICNFHTLQVTFVKEFGSKKILITKELPTVTLNENESIQLYCEGALRMDCNGYNNYNSYEYLQKLPDLNLIEVRCFLNELFLKQHQSKKFCRNVLISCSESSGLKLYESNQKLPHCDKYMSMGIGASFSELEEVSLAICYDWENLSLKYVAFLTSYSNTNLEVFYKNQHSKKLDIVTLDKVLDNYELYFDFMSDPSFQVQLKDLRLRNAILNGLDFDYLSIADASKFTAQTKILNIVWWRNLHQGNWRQYQTILKQRTNTVQYQVYLGTAGIISIPTENCNQNQALLNAPEYIWSYLISTNSSQNAEELVIVAYNSPFAKLNEENSPIFCQDICDEVSWLNSTIFRELRLIPTQGVMFCCRPEDVSQQFPSFPINTNREISAPPILHNTFEQFPYLPINTNREILDPPILDSDEEMTLDDKSNSNINFMEI
ncbi:uncharacterized protein LOC119672993 [Teleopsis dalmanni]|uniref:uncharacterized protein LOC119672993 n=1 Tax=Teleopsis dalmanni TaxID=139649 RepID=UPI0018CEDAE0|nr:uncharacterized protein LOC119672993 [Teleopsis dalmanni]